MEPFPQIIRMKTHRSWLKIVIDDQLRPFLELSSRQGAQPGDLGLLDRRVVAGRPELSRPAHRGDVGGGGDYNVVPASFEDVAVVSRCPNRPQHEVRDGGVDLIRESEV